MSRVMNLLSYHNDENIKLKYLARVQAHFEADEIIKGKYWGNGKGCAVGCTIHGQNYAAYEIELGLPVWLAKLEDCLFEGMRNEDAKIFPVRFLESIPVGKSLDRVKWKFLLFVLDNCKDIIAKSSISIDQSLKDDIIKCNEKITAVLKKALKIGFVDITDAATFSYAASYASYASYASDVAVYAAAYADADADAVAAAVAYAAYAADAGATYATATAAAAAYAVAAYAGARSNTYKTYADKLIELLKET